MVAPTCHHLKKNKGWIPLQHPWQRKFELQYKENLCYRIVDLYLSFDPKTLTNGNYRELWNKQCDYVNLLFNNHIKTSLTKIIRDDDSVKDRPHFIWQNLIAYYEDSAMTQSNASLIGIGLSQLRTSQFNSHMHFLAKFLYK